MRKEKFVYNTQTLRYEKVEEPLKVKILRAFGFLCAVLVFATIIVFIAYSYFDSPKEKILKREIDKMTFEYDMVSTKIDVASKVIDHLQERDAHVYRMMFGVDPIDEDVWNAGRGGSKKYEHLENYSNKELMKNTAAKIAKLEKQVALQSKSFDMITELVNEQEKMISSIPSIRPVRKLTRNIKLFSGFGMRIHPIHKIRKMHWGIDFTAPKGTPIYVTGDGKVTKVRSSKTGYGKHIIVDHGYGYKTLYAHMHTIEVKAGHKVKKGEIIGTIGSTGTSTAPHLHYEVEYKGKKINPIYFCQDDLSPEEYRELVEFASISNQSFD